MLCVGMWAPTLRVGRRTQRGRACETTQSVVSSGSGSLRSTRPFPLVLCVLSLVALAISAARPALVLGQEPTGAQALAALESTLVDSIAKAEKSVVAIGRVRKNSNASVDPVETGGLRGAFELEIDNDPTRPGFMPHEFGAGVVIDSSGLILTTYHLLGEIGESQYWVWSAGKPYPATVKAADPWLDLAVLKTDAVGLQPIQFGDASTLRKGQIVIALGNPHGIARDGQPSAAWGIVSNLSRQAPSSSTTRPAEGRETLHHYGTLIQTDARLEHGTSGGALVNLKGEMVGLTTSLAALSNSERPGGFAIPVDADFRRTVETLKTGRMPDYGFLGVAPTHLSAEQRRAGLTGARILDVVPATPAAKAGLQVGDIITHVDDEPIADEVHLIRRLSGLPADTTVTLKVERGGMVSRPGRTVATKVTLSKKRVDGPRQPYAEVVEPAWRGIHVDYATASPLFREQSRDLDPEGSVAIVDVDRDSVAWKAGFRPGDFVSHVGKSRVATPQQFREAVATQRGPVTMRLTAADNPNAVRTVEPETNSQ